MRISTTPFLIVCTVFFFLLFEAKAQAPVFTVDNLQHTCGPGTPATGGFMVNITNADLTQPSLEVRVQQGLTNIIQVLSPIPPLPIHVPITGLTGSATGKSYLVIVADQNNSSVASNGVNFTIFNFTASLNGGPVNNTNADCSAPNGAINVTLTGTSGATPIVYSWSGPAGFVDPGTKNISGLRGGSYTLTYKDSNSPATQCTLGPITITDPAPASFTISGPASVCQGNGVSVTVSATTVGYTYSVLEGATVLASQAGTGSSMSIAVPAAAIATTGSHTLTVQAVQGSCLPTNNTAPDLSLTVNPTPTYTGNTTASVCSSVAIGVNLASFKSGGTDATSFNVLSINPGTMTTTNAVTGIVAVNDLANDLWRNTSNAQQPVSYTIEPMIGTCPGAQFIVTVPIDPQPDFNNLNATAVCSSTAIGVTLDGQQKGTSVAAASYNIVLISPHGMPRAGGTSAAGPATNTSIQADKWLNTTSASINVDYSIRPVSASGCQGDIFTVSVPITPQPAYTSFSVAPGVCSQSALGVDLTGKQNAGSVAATSFLVTNVNAHGMTAVGTVTANGDNIAPTDLMDDKWKNTSNANLTVDYDLKPSVGGCSGNTFTVSVTVRPEPDYNATNSPAAICSDAGTGVNLDTFAKGTSVVATSYDITAINPHPTLTAKSVNLVLPRSNKTNTEIANDQWENLTPTARPVDYTVVPWNGTCAGSAFTVTITVSPEPNVNDYDSSPGGVCSGDVIGVDFATLAVGGSVVADSYKINTIVSTGLTPLAGNSVAGSTGSATMISGDKYTNATSGSLPVKYNVTPFKGTCAGDPFDITVLIVPRPSYSSFNDLTGICATALGIDLASQINAGSVTATSFTIQSITAPGLTKTGAPYGPFPVTGLASNAIAGDMWSNPTAGNLNVDYAIIPVNGTCDGNVFHVIFTIKPQPVYSSSTATICSNTQLNYDLITNKNATSAAATSYAISIAPDPLLSNASATPTAANASSLTDKWRNFTAGPLDVTYTITPSTNGCAGAQFTVKYTIDPEPVYNNSTLPAICSDTNIGFDLETVFSGTSVQANSFSYTYVADPLLTSAVPATGTGNRNLISAHQWRNTTSGNLQVVYSITPKSAAGCDGAIFKITVVIAPQPDYNDDPVGNKCGEVPLNIDLNALKKATSVAADSFIGVSVTPDNPITIPAGAPNIVAGKLMDTWSNLSNVAVTITYKIRPVIGTCQGDPFTLTVTIQPEPDYNTTSKTLCSRDALAIDLDGLAKATSVIADSYTINSITFDPTMLTSTGTALTTGPGLSTSAISGHAFKNVTSASQDVLYKIVPVKNGCPGPEIQITIHVNPEPKGADNAVTICSSTAINYDLQNNITTLGNGLAGVTFSWVAADNTNVSGESLVSQAGGTITDNLVNTTAAVEPVVYTVTPTSAVGCAGSTFKITVNVTPQPDYNDDPVGNKCGEVPLNIDLTTLKKATSVAADSYIGVSVTPDNPITIPAGAPNIVAGKITDIWSNTSNVAVTITYTIRPVAGTCQGNPFTVTVTIQPEPDYNTTSKTICSRDALAIDLDGLVKATSVVADSYTINSITFDPTMLTSTGTALTTGPGLTTTAISGHAFKNVTSASQDVLYKIVPVKNGCGGPEFQITIHVNPEPKGGDAPTTICSGTAVNYDLQNNITTLGNGLAGVTFSWIAADNVNVTGESLVSQAGGTITDNLVNTSTADQVVVYTVTPTSISGCAGATFQISVTISPKPVLAAGQTATICSGTAVGYSFILNPANLPAGTTFSWIANDNPSVTGEGLTTQTTATINDVLVVTGAVPQNVTYVVTPIYNGCPGAPDNVMITVNPAAVAEAGNNQAICNDNGPYTLVGSSVSGAASTGTWSFSSQPAGGDGVISVLTPMANPATATFTATVAGDYVLTLTTDDPAGICGPVSDAVTITVTPRPVITPGQTKLVCANDPVGYEIQMTPANLPLNTVFDWADPDGPSGATNASAGVAVPMGAPGTIHINDILRNTGSSNIDVTYAVTPSVGLCVGTQQNIVITVKPAPNVAFGQTKTICSGDRVDYEILLSPANSPAGTTFSWPDPDGTGSATSELNIAADPAGTLHLTDTLYNGTGAPIHVVYSVISRGINGCLGVTRDIDIVVNPGAIADAGNAQAICSSGTATLSGSSVGGLATQGTWTIKNSPAGGDGAITNGTATTTPAAATFTATVGGTYTLQLMTDDPAGSCPAVSDVVVITVKNPGDPSCTGGSGTCSNVSIAPIPTPAHCNNSDGSVFFDINPAVPISGDVTITVDGTGSTVLPSPRTNINNFTFDILAVGTYSYTIVYGDASCTKTGVFSIDRSGTVGTVTASNLIDPVCFGNTGTATLDVPGETGNILVWSVDGVNFNNFVVGNPVTGLPNGLVSVKRLGDTCAAGVILNFNMPAEIPVTATAADATCAGNDGSITVSNLTGGTSPYTFTVNGVATNLPADNTFHGLGANTYNVVVKDSKGCTKALDPITIRFLVGPATLDTLFVKTSVSVPDLASGSALVGVQPSGLEPYETRLELTTPLFSSEAFVQDWTEVPLNPQDLKFEQSYTNIFAGQYTLGLRDASGCTKTYLFTIDVDTDLFIPNIFTPNGDGSNEVFYVRNLPGADAKLLVANRWGKEVYKSSSYQNDWNGGDTVDGLYYYTLTVAGKKYAGWVEILRGQ
jgi:gliding motility-associated-like protein